MRDYLDPEKFARLMGEKGISPDTKVVFYGDKNNWWATYALWVFRLFGHDNVAVMDGGRVKWEAEGREMTQDVPSVSAGRLPGPDPRRLEDKGLQGRRREAPGEGTPGDGDLIDVRSPGEYSGELLHMPDYPQEGALRGGHIPGAANVPWARAAREDGTFKSADELKGIYEGEAGLSGDGDVDRLLPHRGALQPHLVRALLPARLRQGTQLRRLVDGVGQLRGRPHRAVRAHWTGASG